MPVTTGYSADPEKTYSEKTSSINATSFTSHDLRASAGAHSSPNGSISSYSRTNSVDSLDDSQSSSSGGSASGHSRQVSNDSTTGSGDYIPTRSIKQANKPQHNALQFVKIGSCPLYKQAAEQMKKAEEVKKMKTVTKQDEEDWQHNLDNWKSKRRLSCQKSHERADELRRLEEEELNYLDKGRRKSKTFSEMVEERSKRGRKLGYFSDEWDDTDSGVKGGSWDGSDSPRHDLSIDSTGSDPVFRDDESSDTSSVDRNHPETSELKLKENNLEFGEKNGNSDIVQEHKSPVNGCENGENNANPFEKAIQSYVQFAESQKKTMNHDKKTTNGSLAHKPRKFSEDEAIISKTIPEENGSSEKKTNGTAAFCGDRTGGTEMSIVVTLKSGSEHRDFGFTTKGQGRGLVFVESISSRGPADNAGLRIDDEVLAINGESVSNRSHSAIVFAIKQALYTGRLELGIYRYNNANQIPKQGISNVSNKKPSRIEEKKAVFSRDNSNEKESNPDKRILREKSPKVDIVKRRSMFESPPKEIGEIQQQRRSLDASTALKNKILSFENLENIDKYSDGKKISTKQKKLPSEQQNGTDRKSDFMKRLTSFENLDSVGNNNYSNNVTKSSPERKQSLKDKIDVFEKPEVFERSQSCDFLNADHKPDRVLMSPLSNERNLNDDSRIQSPQDETASENSFDWDSVDNDNYSDDPIGPPRIIDVVTKEESPEPTTLGSETQHNPNLTDLSSQIPNPSNANDDRKPDNLSSESDAPVPEEKKVEELMKKTVLSPAEDVEVNSVCLTKNNELHNLSPFELAESLEETPFVGSNPSSPSWMHNAQNTFPDLTGKNVMNVEETNYLYPNGPHDITDNGSQISMEHEIQPLDMTHLGEELYIVDDFDFDAPPRVCEPPKEKPPPPPVESDTSFDQTDSKNVQLKRVESTKRIKKELQRLRSDFLGFDSANKYTDQESLPFSVGENISSSEKNQGENQMEEPTSTKQDYVNWENGIDTIDSSKQLQEDESYTEADNKMNEEDEIARKEKEIIEDLEREEQMKTSLKFNDIYKVNDDNHLKKVNEESQNLELERLRQEDEKRRQEEEKRLRDREEQLRQQEELLRLEKEKLRREQEELMRQREEYQRKIQEHQFMHPPFIPPAVNPKKGSVLQRSLSDNGLQADYVEYPAKSIPIEAHPRMPKKDAKISSVSSQIPASSPENKVVEETFSKTICSPPDQLGFPEDEVLPLRNKSDNNPPPSAPKLSSHIMRPKSKILNNNEKCPVRRKPDAHSKNLSSYNQHWLIQEAEMRRISEQQDRLRQARSPTRESTNEGKQFPDRTKPVANPTSYSQRPQMTQNNFYGKPMNYNSHQGQPKRPVVSPHEQFSSRSPDYIEVQTTNPLLPSKNSVQNPMGSLANGDPHMLSVSGKKKCSHCGDELGKGAAMIIESLHLFYHIHCFKCCVCHVQLGNGLSGADVRVRNQKLHCHNCYSNDEAGLKFSKV